jgi:hypothetical protein
VRTAFFNGDVDTKIYMEQPIGFNSQIESSVPRASTVKGSPIVCLLKKAIYGLKQSARVWNKKFDSFLKEYDLLISNTDCYVYINKKGPKLIICIWVDDGIVCSTFNDSIVDILNYIQGAF